MITQGRTMCLAFLACPPPPHTNVNSSHTPHLEMIFLLTNKSIVSIGKVETFVSINTIIRQWPIQSGK